MTQKNTPTAKNTVGAHIQHPQYTTTDNPFAGITPAAGLSTGQQLGYYPQPKSSKPQHTKPERFIDLAELEALIAAPLSTAKEQLPLITPHSANGKTAEAARQASYDIAVADFDGVRQEMADIVAEVQGKHGYKGALLYFTSSSHGSITDKRGNPKHPNNYKAIIPLAAPSNADEYHAVSTGLNLLLGGDVAQGRRYQGFYAPNSNTAGKPYEGEAINMEGGHLTKDCQLYKAAIASYTAHVKAQDDKARAAIPKPRPANLSPTGGGIYELINNTYSLEQMLESYGHKRRGQRWLSPHSSTNIAGGVILKDGRFYSHHGEACPLSSLNHDGHSLDTAEALCILKYDNDSAAMIAAEATLLDADGQQQRQRDEMQRREQARDAAPPPPPGAVKNDLAPIAPKPTPINKNAERIYSIIKDTVIGRRAKDLALSVEIPTDTACLAGLGVISAVLAGARTVERRGGYGKVPTGLYIAVEQPPSTGKSRIIDGFRDCIKDYIKEENAKIVRAANQEAEAAGDEPPKKIRQLDLFTGNATPEALELVADGNRGLFTVVGDEQNSIETLLGLTYGDKGSNNNGIVLNGFAGEYFNTARVSRNTYKGHVYGGVTVVAQEGTARKIVQGSQGQGVVERFLLWNEPNLLGSRTLEYHEMTTESEYSRVAANLAKLVGAEFAKGEGDFKSLPALKIPPLGWAAIQAFRRELEPQLADGERYSHPLLRGAVGKIDMQVMKIAATLHIADECLALATPDTTYWQPHHEIGAKYVNMAIAVARVTLERLIITLEANGVIGRDAYSDALASYLETRPKPLTARAIVQSQKNRAIFRDTGSPSRAVNEALQRLIEAELVTATEQVIGGKMQVVYKMH